MAVQAAAVAARAHLAEEDPEERPRAAEGRVAIERRVRGAGGRAHGAHGHQRRSAWPEAKFLPFHVATRIRGADGLGDRRGKEVIAVRFGLHGEDRGTDQEDGHHRHDDVALAGSFDHSPDHEDDGERQHEDQQQVEHVGEASGVGIIRESKKICPLASDWSVGNCVGFVNP